MKDYKKEIPKLMKIVDTMNVSISYFITDDSVIEELALSVSSFLDGLGLTIKNILAKRRHDYDTAVYVHKGKGDLRVFTNHYPTNKEIKRFIKEKEKEIKELKNKL